MNVKDKVVAVTGGAGGLGSAMVEKLAENGAVVWILDMREDAAREKAAEYTARGMKVFGVGMNVSKEEDWDRAVRTIVETSGRLDVVVNLAAINIRHSVETMTIEEWTEMMTVNTGSVFLSAKYAIPVMRAQGGGLFINMPKTGEKTATARHPRWRIPVFSLYGETRKPTSSMIKGLKRIVVDLQDIGVRCYTYLATLKLVLEAAAEHDLEVIVLDRPVPLGGVVDGPMPDGEHMSFVCPAMLPLCHGMTIGEEARYLSADIPGVRLSVVKMKCWSHDQYDPWPDFLPPSPGIKSWDTATLYPVTVFTEAYPALDCDRDGPLAFRVIGAPWMDARALMEDLRVGLDTCGVEMRPYRYMPRGGRYSCFNLNGIMFSVSRPYGYNPVAAGALILAAIMKRYGDKVRIGSKPDHLDKLMGTEVVRNAIERDDLGDLFQSWIDAHDEFEKTRVCLYSA